MSYGIRLLWEQLYPCLYHFVVVVVVMWWSLFSSSLLSFFFCHLSSLGEALCVCLRMHQPFVLPFLFNKIFTASKIYYFDFLICFSDTYKMWSIECLPYASIFTVHFTPKHGWVSKTKMQGGLPRPSFSTWNQSAWAPDGGKVRIFNYLASL